MELLELTLEMESVVATCTCGTHTYIHTGVQDGACDNTQNAVVQHGEINHHSLQYAGAID